MTQPTVASVSFQLAQTRICLQIGMKSCGGSWNAERHCNAQYEFHILRSGSSRFNLDENIYSLKAGDAVIVAPGQYHCGYQTSEDFGRFTVGFWLDSGHLERQLKQISQSSPVFSLQEKTLRLCRSIMDELCSENNFRRDMLYTLCVQLMIQLFRELQIEPQAPQSECEAMDVLRTDIIDWFFSMDTVPMGTEEELARQLDMSRRQLNRVLMQHYGMGFRQKMLQARMEYAGWLLRTTDYKVSKIAGMSGYAADTAFYKAFQRYFHMTPQQYRGENVK